MNALSRFSLDTCHRLWNIAHGYVYGLFDCNLFTWIWQKYLYYYYYNWFNLINNYFVGWFNYRQNAGKSMEYCRWRWQLCEPQVSRSVIALLSDCACSWRNVLVGEVERSFGQEQIDGPAVFYMRYCIISLH